MFSLLLYMYFANSVDPDQMPHSVASKLGLHCLHNTSKRVSSLKGVILHFRSRMVYNHIASILSHKGCTQRAFQR